MIVKKEHILFIRIILFILSYIWFFGLFTTLIDIFTDLTIINLLTIRSISIILALITTFITKISFNKNENN